VELRGLNATLESLGLICKDLLKTRGLIERIWKYSDCELISEKGRGLDEKVAEIWVSRNYFLMEKFVD
jgi:hypothetical protein